MKFKTHEEITAEDLHFLLRCSFDYCLGRRTYAPSMCQELLKRYREVLRLHDFKYFIEQIENKAAIPGFLGNDVDLMGWLRFQDWCRGAIEELRKQTEMKHEDEG